MMEFNRIYLDERGEINSITGLNQYEELAIFTTKKGNARGGCVHNINDEYCVVIEGVITFYLDGVAFNMTAGQSIKIERGSPHYYIAVTDSVVIEWGATAEEKKNKHTETRKLVEMINNEIHKSD